MKRRNDEIKRLNELYIDIIPVKNTLQKCLKYLCQTEPYRMLKNWSYEMQADPLDDSEQPAATPEHVSRNTENELIELQKISDEVVKHICAKVTLRQRNNKRHEVSVHNIIAR